MTVVGSRFGESALPGRYRVRPSRREGDFVNRTTSLRERSDAVQDFGSGIRVVVRYASWFIFVTVICVGSSTSAQTADRTTLLIPLAAKATSELPSNALFADAAFDSDGVPGWEAYIRLWKAHHGDPANPIIRRYLGLPLKEMAQVKQRPGRSAPRWLAWRGGSYSQFDTPHFVIYSRADAQTSRRVIEDLERCYWVWTQMFFPLWEAHNQVVATFADLSEDQSITEYLQNQSARLGTRPKLRIVLFRSADEYRQTIDIPGVERSTGFYSDEKKTTFLYAADTDDAATRRHELVHQLFREATNSGLRRQMPAEDSGFWLIEGIAGYFESLHIGDGYATVGGWDSPRLQFARYRFFVTGDRMPMNELRRDGRLAVQRRSDIARWYAHAIAQTHRLLDAGNVAQRRWIYQTLADQYRVKTDMDIVEGGSEHATSLLDFLSVDDEHIAANQVERQLTHLCLSGCPVTPTGLNQIPPSMELHRLTLVGQSIDVDSVSQLVPNPKSIQQLSLEGTAIDSTIAQLLGATENLRELDLSSTAVDDSVIRSIERASHLTTLWMTGTRVSDQSIATIRNMTSLKNVDLQRTKVTEQGIARLKTLKPDLNVNPLEIQEP
jgi:hypothetical protein